MIFTKHGDPVFLKTWSAFFFQNDGVIWSWKGFSKMENIAYFLSAKYELVTIWSTMRNSNVQLIKDMTISTFHYHMTSSSYNIWDSYSFSSNSEIQFLQKRSNHMIMENVFTVVWNYTIDDCVQFICNVVHNSEEQQIWLFYGLVTKTIHAHMNPSD